MAKSGFYQSNTTTEETTTELSSTTDFGDTSRNAKSSFYQTNLEYEATTDAQTAVADAEAAQAYAEEWTNKAEDSLISAAAGGDQVDDYSALHHAAKTAADVVTTNADVVLTGLDVAATNADVVTTNANVVLTGLDVAATNADVVTTNANVVLTGLDVAATNADVVATNADVVATNADVVQTGLDVAATNADVVTTNADVVLTNADVVLTGLDVGYAQEWAIAVEDTPVSVAAGGDASTTFSALHWAAKAAATAAAIGDLNSLSDVTITTVGTGELVAWNGSAWVNQTLDEVSAVLNDLDTLGAAASDGQFIVATGAGAFAYESGATARTSLGVYSTAETDSAIAAAVTAEDLDITGDTGTIAIDLDSEVLSFTGGTGITTTASVNDVSFAIDSTVATLTGSQTLTNKTIDLANNTVTMTQAQLDAAVSDGNVVYTDDIGVSVQGYDADTVKYDVTGAFTTDQDFQAQLEISEELLIDGLSSPAQITANQNDYSVGVGVNVVRLDSDAARSITGISASQVEGRLLILQNDGAFTITLLDENASSTAANRFDLGGGSDLSLEAGGMALLMYDGTASRWRAISGGAAGGGGLNNVVDDLTPQLGADLDAQTFAITDLGSLALGGATALEVNKFQTPSGSVFTPDYQQLATDWEGCAAAIGRYSNSAGATSFVMGKSRGASIGSYTIVQDNDRIGEIGFCGADGTDFVPAASIKAEVDGTPGANDMPGRLLFHTTADGAATVTERMRITSAGQVLIGTAGDPVSFGEALEVAGTTGLTSSMALCRFAANANDPDINFFKSRGATVGAHTIVQDGDGLGTLAWYASDGTDWQVSAQLAVHVDGTPGATNDMPGRFVFNLTPDGSGTLGEVMRITNAGNVQPGSNDGGSLGVSGTAWSDLFLADGGAINWNNGEWVLQQAGDIMKWTLDPAASSGGLEVQYVADHSTGFGTAGDDLFTESIRGRDDAGGLVEYTRIIHEIGDPATGAVDGKIRFFTRVGSVLTEPLRLENNSVRPASDDAITLGTTTVGWSDLYLADGGLVDWGDGSINFVAADNDMYFDVATGDTFTFRINASQHLILSNTDMISPSAIDLGAGSFPFGDLFLSSGGVVNWNNGDVTITHSANALAFAGATSGYSFDDAVMVGSGAADKGAGTVNANSGVFDGGNRLGMVRLMSGTVSNQATADLDFSAYSGYRAYKIYLTEIDAATDNQMMRMRTSNDGGTTFDSGASNYTWAYLELFDDSSVRYGASASSTGNNSYLQLRTSNGNAASEQANVEITLFSPESSTDYTHINWWTTGYHSSGVLDYYTGSGARKANEVVDAVRIYMASGNITLNYAVYGVL